VSLTHQQEAEGQGDLEEVSSRGYRERRRKKSYLSGCWT